MMSVLDLFLSFVTDENGKTFKICAALVQTVLFLLFDMLLYKIILCCNEYICSRYIHNCIE